MNVDVLLDSVVQQMTKLLARVATAHGKRASLVHVEDQVFLQLTEALSHIGISRKVSADMFGLTSRSYLRKIQRLSGSTTEHGRSLWEAVLTFFGDGQQRSRAELIGHFHKDDSELLAGVVHDLCESGLLVRQRRGASTLYRAANPQELRDMVHGEAHECLDPVLWALIYRLGPITLDELNERVRSRGVQSALCRLLAQRRVTCRTEGGKELYSAPEFSLARESAQGWEAAVFDHIQAVVGTICARLSGDVEAAGTTGGSTYSVEVWPGHPLEEEVLSQLDLFRERMSDLRSRVRAVNGRSARPPETYGVTIYSGEIVAKKKHEQEGRMDNVPTGEEFAGT